MAHTHRYYAPCPSPTTCSGRMSKQARKQTPRGEEPQCGGGLLTDCMLNRSRIEAASNLFCCSTGQAKILVSEGLESKAALLARGRLRVARILGIGKGFIEIFDRIEREAQND